MEELRIKNMMNIITPIAKKVSFTGFMKLKFAKAAIEKISISNETRLKLECFII